MVIYLIKKDTDIDRTTSNNEGRIIDTPDLARLALISALLSKRDQGSG